MIVRDVEQGSPEWLALRAGRITASRFGDVLAKGNGVTRRKYMLKLLGERLTGLPGETYTNEAMQWGTETEPRARAVYELETGYEVEQVAMVIHSDDVACSPDGLIDLDGGLEIKCPNTETHLDTWESQKVPSRYIPQVQGCMWVAVKDWWDFVSYDPRLPDTHNLVILRVERDDQYIRRLREEVEAFAYELKQLELRGIET